MSKPVFCIDITLHTTLTLEQIWPDGDAPAEPTIEDVWKAFCPRRGNARDLLRACQDWDLLDVDEHCVRIYRLEAPVVRPKTLDKK